MTTEPADISLLRPRPKRADARRNYEKLLEAARAAFNEDDVDTSLEDIARRAQLGIGTLYRHFPTREDLIEAVYVDEVEALARSAREHADLPPWEALTGWLARFVGYVATKQALAAELFATSGRSATVFADCRRALFSSGGPLLERAQAAGRVREDVSISDVLHLVTGIAKISTAKPGQVDRLLLVALDGLRSRGPGRAGD